MLLSVRAEGDLHFFNPFSSAADLNRALEYTLLALFTANRVGHVQRCLVEVRELEDLLQQLQGSSQGSVDSLEAMKHATLSKAEMLASSLTARRHYVESSTRMVTGGELGETTHVAEFDPRLLVFEFTHDLMLRDAQVALLGRFLDARRRGSSLCHQLIMGQGKTTVIAPLLGIMIADGNVVVISIVPPHLLPSARTVLREKLAASLQRPVYGMTFDRYTPVTASLIQLLRHASALRGVLLTEPYAAL